MCSKPYWDEQRLVFINELPSRIIYNYLICNYLWEIIFLVIFCCFGLLCADTLNNIYIQSIDIV